MFIINPISGTSRKKEIPYSIYHELKLRYDHIEIVFTEHEGHATALAHQAVDESYGYVFAYGGDGTVNEVAKALIHSETTLGILPAGSGNGLARHLGIPLETKNALKLLFNPKHIAIDTCKVNATSFFCTAGFGFDAQVSHTFAQSTSRGLTTYAKSVLEEFQTHRPKRYRFEVDGKPFEREVFSLTLANAGQYGNNAWIAPEADITDGQVDVCLLKPFPFYEVLPLAIRTFTKTLHKSEYLEVIRGRHIEVFTEEGEKVHLDGEPKKMEHSVLHCEVIPNSLNVLVG